MTTEPKFKIGDRVRLLRQTRPHSGKAGVVENIEATRHGIRYTVFLDLMRNSRLPHSKEYWESELRLA